MSKECKWLHEVLEQLPIVRYPFNLNQLPTRGIYFFYEKGEVWGHGGNKPRIVRIGTHRKDNFRQRIASHFLINKRGSFNVNQPKPSDRSIFRRNIGRALLNKNNDSYLSIWDIDFTTKESRTNCKHLRKADKEIAIEHQITFILRNNFYFRYIIIDDEKNRIGSSGLESKLIATVSECRLCNPSIGWLGNYSTKPQIKSSGLWLTQHLKSSIIDKSDKLTIEKAIKDTLIYLKSIYRIM